jgi:hypothetical protein
MYIKKCKNIQDKYLKFINNLIKSKIKVLKILKRYINCINKYCYEFNTNKELEDNKL